MWVELQGEKWEICGSSASPPMIQPQVRVGMKDSACNPDSTLASPVPTRWQDLVIVLLSKLEPGHQPTYWRHLTQSHGFKYHLLANDIHVYLLALTSPMESRLVCLTANLTLIFGISNCKWPKPNSCLPDIQTCFFSIFSLRNQHHWPAIPLQSVNESWWLHLLRYTPTLSTSLRPHCYRPIPSMGLFFSPLDLSPCFTAASIRWSFFRVN